MTPLQDKLRAALRETADEIPGEAPPLRLPARKRTAKHGPSGQRWRAWAAPLAAAAVVVAIVAASVSLAGGLRPGPSTQGQPVSADGSLPPYYVALITQRPDADIYELGATAAELRSTVTGRVLARVTPPRPYVSFTGVTAAADDRTFVLSAQGRNEPPAGLNQYYPAQRFFLLRIDPGAPANARMSLTALPGAYTPANAPIHDMALSPDGTKLAADVGGLITSAQLTVFDLATGTQRAWSARTCAPCGPTSGGLGYGGVNVDALSWTADSQHVAFIWGNTVRLLDTRAPGSGLLTNSRLLATWTTGQTVNDMWRGAIVTPDGRSVLGIEEIASSGSGSAMTLRELLVRFATASGRQATVINNLNVLKLNSYEQVLYTSTTGATLVLTGLRPGQNVTIVRDGRQTPLPWSPYIGVAAW